MTRILVGIMLVCAASAAAQTPSGEDVYRQRCATCHEQANSRIPPRSTLEKMPAARIVRALDSGAMMSVAFTMSRNERLAVASYLGTSDAVAGPPPSAFCANRNISLATTPAVTWNGWSPGTNNARFQPAAAARLTAAQVPQLKLKWAFAFDGDVAAFAPPTVLDGYVFVGSAAGVMHAMRADSGCLLWTFQANGPVRSAPLAATVGPRHVLLFGDMAGWFYALDAANGSALWKVHIDEHDSTRLTAAAIANGDIVYIPVASWEETRSSDAMYPCCTFRGSVVALRIADGTQVWKTYLVDEPKERARTDRGVARLGPSGVAVWSTPTLDLKRRRLYVTTGDNYSAPATALSDAIIALDLDSGRIAWSRQVTQDDVFNGHCGGGGANCPPVMGPDFDFGSSAILLTADGRDLLVAGQKSGLVFGLDPDKDGDILWQTRVGQGGTGGGVQWGMAADGQLVYAAVADYGRSRQNNPLDTRRYLVDPKVGGGLTALRVTDGSKQWFAAPIIACQEGAPSGCSPAQAAAVTAIPGVVFSAAYDGHVRAFSTADGKVLWDVDTMREFDTANGIKAHGGSIDGPGPVVAGGMVFVTSGYPRNGGVPGNVLLAFAP